MNWSDFIFKDMQFNVPYYAIKCSDIRTFRYCTEDNPELTKEEIRNELHDLRMDNMYIGGKFQSLELVEPSSGTLERLFNRLIELGTHICTDYPTAHINELALKPDIKEELKAISGDFGMIYPEFLHDIRYQSGSMRRSLELYDIVGIDLIEFPHEIVCDAELICHELIALARIFQCLRALGGSYEIPHTLLDHWDNNKTQAENINRALSVTLGDACDAAVHFKFELDKDGMPHSRMVYETPLDAMFAIIGNAFITASTMVRRTAVCDWCGKVFPAKTKRAQYCSYRCQKAGWRAKQKLKEDKSNNVKTETQGE